jgi:F420-dependent oxidoreductase-like protein
MGRLRRSVVPTLRQILTIRQKLYGSGAVPAKGRAGAGRREQSPASYARLSGMTRLGYQIPNYTYPGVGPDGLFEVVARQAEAADASGFDTVMVMDHFYQLPMLGPPEHEMLECYSMLAALAGRTSRCRLGALVTGNTYRNPALLAKTVTTLDVISGGRAQLGIGAGWFELEHDALGFEFGTFTDRFQKLEEALEIITPMLRGERVTFEGRWYQVRDAVNSPAPVERIPVLIGGSGERKTFRLVARFADESNLTCSPEEVPAKLEALAARCSEEGRDRSELTVSLQRPCLIAPTHEAAWETGKAFFAERGLDLEALSEEERAPFLALVAWGSPDEVAEQLGDLLALGVDGLTLSLPANGHDPEMVSLLGETAAPLFSS